MAARLVLAEVYPRWRVVFPNTRRLMTIVDEYVNRGAER